MAKNIVLIRFSSREEGNCAAIVAFLASYYEQENTVTYTIDESIVTACNHCSYECLKAGAVCPNLNPGQKKVMDAICSADLTYFLIPNYCGYPCANYFAFNERSVGYFNKDRSLMNKYMEAPKRFIIVSNSEENFENAMQQQVWGIPDILYMKTSKYCSRSTDGNIMDAMQAKSDLRSFLSVHCF